MKKFFLFNFIFFLAAGCQPGYSQPIVPAPIACTQEAKQCPDGSYVSRSGPKCEFAACPSADKTLNSGIEGKILLGPTCPVERIPPDPACAPKAYQATIIVESADGQSEILRFTSNLDGSFKQALPAGNYLLVPISGQPYPRGQQQQVSVLVNNYAQVNISFDSGIR